MNIDYLVFVYIDELPKEGKHKNTFIGSNENNGCKMRNE